MEDTIKNYQPLDHDLFIEESKSSTIFHTIDWNNILSSHFSSKNSRFYYLMAFENNHGCFLFNDLSRPAWR